MDSAGIIHTIVGTGVAGFNGDGGPALEASLDSPQAVTTLPTGEIVISDEHNHRIRLVHLDGTVSTIAGIGLAAFCGDEDQARKACLSDPEGVVFDPDRRQLLLLDGDNHRIRAIDSEGVIRTIAGSGPIGRKV